MAQERRQYTREYKIEAVRLVDEEERPLAQVARELGIGRNLLQRWKRELKGAGVREAFPGNGKLMPQDEEIRRLRRELEQVRQERDFLKSGSVLREGVAVKYACMEAHRQEFARASMRGRRTARVSSSAETSDFAAGSASCTAPASGATAARGCMPNCRHRARSELHA